MSPHSYLLLMIPATQPEALTVDKWYVSPLHGIKRRIAVASSLLLGMAKFLIGGF